VTDDKAHRDEKKSLEELYRHLESEFASVIENPGSRVDITIKLKDHPNVFGKPEEEPDEDSEKDSEEEEEEEEEEEKEEEEYHNRIPILDCERGFINILEAVRKPVYDLKQARSEVNLYWHDSREEPIELREHFHLKQE
jgi:chromatin remodeling complex protein RSC6